MPDRDLYKKKCLNTACSVDDKAGRNKKHKIILRNGKYMYVVKKQLYFLAQ